MPLACSPISRENIRQRFTSSMAVASHFSPRSCIRSISHGHNCTDQQNAHWIGIESILQSTMKKSDAGDLLVTHRSRRTGQCNQLDTNTWETLPCLDSKCHHWHTRSPHSSHWLEQRTDRRTARETTNVLRKSCSQYRPVKPLRHAHVCKSTVGQTPPF